MRNYSYSAGELHEQRIYGVLDGLLVKKRTELINSILSWVSWCTKAHLVGVQYLRSWGLTLDAFVMSRLLDNEGGGFNGTET